MRPRIGLMGSLADGLIAVNRNYLYALWRAGGEGVLLPYTDDFEMMKAFAAELDGFLFCGGVDIDPGYYNELPSAEMGEVCPERDRFESDMFQMIYPTGKPILGICRGEQVLNVFLGGSLNQHLEGHCQSADLPKNTREQRVCLTEEGYLRHLLGRQEMLVNSFHHQSVKELGRGLVPDAVAEDGCIEAYHSEAHRFLLGVQWHPEIYDTLCSTSREIFRTFVLACKDEDFSIDRHMKRSYEKR